MRRNQSALPGWETLREPEQTPSVDAQTDDESIDQIASSVPSPEGATKRRAGTPPTPLTRPAKRARLSTQERNKHASPNKTPLQKNADRDARPSQSARGAASRLPATLSTPSTVAGKRVKSGGAGVSSAAGPSSPALAFPKRPQRTTWRGGPPRRQDSPSKRAACVINLSSASDDEPSMAGQKKRFKQISPKVPPLPNSHRTPSGSGQKTNAAPRSPDEVIVISSDSEDDAPRPEVLASARYDRLMAAAKPQSQSKSKSQSQSQSKSRSPVVSRSGAKRPARSPTQGRTASTPVRPVDTEPIVIMSSSSEHSPEPAGDDVEMPPPEHLPSPTRSPSLNLELPSSYEGSTHPPTSAHSMLRKSSLSVINAAFAKLTSPAVLPGSANTPSEHSSASQDRDGVKDGATARASAPSSPEKELARTESNDSDLFPLGDSESPARPAAHSPPPDVTMDLEIPDLTLDSANADVEQTDDLQSLDISDVRSPATSPTIPQDPQPRSHSQSPASGPPTSASGPPTSISPQPTAHSPSASNSSTQSSSPERARAALKRVRGALYGGSTGFFKDVFRAQRSRPQSQSSSAPNSASSVSDSRAPAEVVRRPAVVEGVTPGPSRGSRGPSGSLSGRAHAALFSPRAPAKGTAQGVGTASTRFDNAGGNQHIIGVGVQVWSDGDGEEGGVGAGALGQHQGTEPVNVDADTQSASALEEAVSKRYGSPMEVDAGVPGPGELADNDAGEPSSLQGVDKLDTPGLEVQSEKVRDHGAEAREQGNEQGRSAASQALAGVQAAGVQAANVVQAASGVRSSLGPTAPPTPAAKRPTATREAPAPSAPKPSPALTSADSLSAVINDAYHAKKRPEVIDLTLDEDEDDDAGGPPASVPTAQDSRKASARQGPAEMPPAPASAPAAPFRVLSRPGKQPRKSSALEDLRNLIKLRRASNPTAAPTSAARTAAAPVPDAGHGATTPAVTEAAAVQDAHLEELLRSDVGMNVDEPEAAPSRRVEPDSGDTSHAAVNADAPRGAPVPVVTPSATNEASGSAQSRVFTTNVTELNTVKPAPPAEGDAASVTIEEKTVEIVKITETASADELQTPAEAEAATDDELECLGMLAYPESSATSEAEDTDALSMASRKKDASRQSSVSSSSVVVRRSSRYRTRRSATTSQSTDPIDLLSDPIEPSTPDSEPAMRASTLLLTQNFSTNVFEDLMIDGMPIIALTPARIMAEFPPPVYYARDLPHVLQDRMNALAPYYRRTEMAHTVFEAVIRENTLEDEPNAPPIHVVNDVDDEATPPWEFHYSNRMWHAEGVPPPDLKNLRGCGCEGVCDPRSKTCSCLMRQQVYIKEAGIQGFIYDDRGRLKIPDYPIFECNDLCGCLDECRNRVVQHGRKHEIDIRKTKDKGWGVFARKKIPKGTFIGIYSGELILDADGDERGQKYNKFGRTYLFGLDFYHLKQFEDDPDEWEPKYVVDAYHAGNFTRFLNHSCDPNCFVHPCYINEANIEKPLLTVFTGEDVEAHEELCFSYHGPPDEDGTHDRNRISASTANDAVYVKCRCGSWNCLGTLFS